MAIASSPITQSKWQLRRTEAAFFRLSPTFLRLDRNGPLP